MKIIPIWPKVSLPIFHQKVLQNCTGLCNPESNLMKSR